MCWLGGGGGGGGTFPHSIIRNGTLKFAQIHLSNFNSFWKLLAVRAPSTQGAFLCLNQAPAVAPDGVERCNILAPLQIPNGKTSLLKLLFFVWVCWSEVTKWIIDLNLLFPVMALWERSLKLIFPFNSISQGRTSLTESLLIRSNSFYPVQLLVNLKVLLLCQWIMFWWHYFILSFTVGRGQIGLSSRTPYLLTFSSSSVYFHSK